MYSNIHNIIIIHDMYIMAEQYLRNLKHFKHLRPLVDHMQVFETFTRCNNKGISRKVRLTNRTSSVYALAAV